jgi:murein L,D-transpeptidase YcbB/YkuD
VSSFTSVTKKIGKVKAENKAIMKEVYEAAKKAGHEIWYIWGMGTSEEHRTGLAADLMVRNEAAGDWVRNYLWKNRKRLRLHHVIWEQHITSTTHNPGQRRKMEDRGNPTANHYDHVHYLLFPGKYQPPTSNSTPNKPSKPAAPSDGKRLLEYDAGKPMMQGQDVRRLQSGLRKHFPLYAGRLVVDGFYGPKTEAAVKEFQRRSGIAADGIVGPVTRKKLERYDIRP